MIANSRFSKSRHLPFWRFNELWSTQTCLLTNDLSGNTVWPHDSGFQKLAKVNIFGVFNQLIVNVAHFAVNVEWDFFRQFWSTVTCFLIRKCRALDWPLTLVPSAAKVSFCVNFLDTLVLRSPFPFQSEIAWFFLILLV